MPQWLTHYIYHIIKLYSNIMHKITIHRAYMIMRTWTKVQKGLLKVIVPLTEVSITNYPNNTLYQQHALKIIICMNSNIRTDFNWFWKCFTVLHCFIFSKEFQVVSPPLPPPLPLPPPRPRPPPRPLSPPNPPRPLGLKPEKQMENHQTVDLCCEKCWWRGFDFKMLI